MDQSEGNSREVYKQYRQRQQSCRCDSRQHVKTLESFVGPASAQQFDSEVVHHLIKPFCPTHPLMPRRFEIDRLFIIQNRCFTVPDDIAVENFIYRKLDILGHRVIFPSAVFFYDLAGYQKSGSGDRAA
ncbi:hypothetical protein SDC9_195051 [bioreactor metagenome]|uniref:Uncharacterized protein n=1 Tax=bioreactor metagenome TaxID=1076179 RepID=A0A645IAH4_9ZZZZ